MDVKVKIGSRITEIRKKRGLTIKALAAQTKVLSAARISNWEQGTRTPGPAEIKLIAEVLEVSASYLLCLTDDPRGDLVTRTDIVPTQIPVLSMAEADISKIKLQRLIKQNTHFSNNVESISIEGNSKQKASKNTFALRIEDNSMSPEFLESDLVIVDIELKPKPGQYIIANLKSEKINILRKLRQTDTTTNKSTYQLIALNPDWGVIQIEHTSNIKIIGVVIEHRRYFN